MTLIPRQPSEITSEWLSHVLDTRVTGTRVQDAHSGTTGRAVLELDCAQPSVLPARLFVKLPPTDDEQRAFVCSSGMGRREAMFYRQLSREVPLRVPHCYYAACNEGGDQYIMLLEHLEDSGCILRGTSARYSMDFVHAMLDAFARLHAHYWESPRFESDLDWVKPPLQHAITGPLIVRALQQYSAQMPAVFTAMGELYLTHTDAIHRLWNSGPSTLIHGDVHDGNLFFEGSTPGFLDWALLARGPAMRDVGYFLAGGLSPQDQQQQQHALLAYYREQLLTNGAPAPAQEDLWRQYQWHAAYVWVGAVVTLAMGDAWQPVNYVLRSLERLHPALEGLDSVGALRAAL